MILSCHRTSAQAQGSDSVNMIQLSKIKKSYASTAGEVTALNGIDLDIGRGEIYGIIGLSGAGKSTALKFFEDMGFYCVDNLPILLIEKFAELTLRDENNASVHILIQKIERRLTKTMIEHKIDNNSHPLTMTFIHKSS